MFVRTIHAQLDSNDVPLCLATSFHNFEHANHVTQSVAKLLSRVKEPNHLYDHDGAFASASDLHHYTYGM